MPECCGRWFDGNSIRNHLDNSYAHSNEIECRWCYARWPTHAGKLRLQHEQREHWLSCDQCTYIFENETALEEHKEEKHPPNYCYGCKRQFMNLNNLNQVGSASFSCLLEPLINSMLISVCKASQVVHSHRQECQMPLVLQHDHQPHWRLSSSGVGLMHFGHRSPENRPLLQRSRPKSRVHQQANRLVQRYFDHQARHERCMGRELVPLLSVSKRICQTQFPKPTP